MTAGICIPKTRSTGLLRAFRAVWTAPTTLIGRGFANLCGCGPAERIGGRASPAYLYRLPPGRLRGLGAIAIGHAIVVEPEFVAGRESWILAHELSHTRQHDWLGPAYLMAHAVFQIISVVLCLLRPVRGFPLQHAYNPLERKLLCVPFDILVDAEQPSGPLARQVLGAFGLASESVA